MKRMRLAMKPYSSRARRTGVLPIARAKSMARRIVSSAVCGPGTTSTEGHEQRRVEEVDVEESARSGSPTARATTDARVDEFRADDGGIIGVARKCARRPPA